MATIAEIVGRGLCSKLRGSGQNRRLPASKMAGPKGSVAVYLLMVSKNQKYVQYAAYDLQDPRVTNNGNQQHGPIAFNGTNIGTQYIPQWCVEHIGSFISQI